MRCTDAFAGFEPVAQELEPLSWDTAVADMRLLGMQRQAVLVHPGADLDEGGIGLLTGPAQDHEVIGITHHAVPALSDNLVQGIEIDVGQ